MNNRTNNQWLEDNAINYLGKYVALRNGVPLAASIHRHTVAQQLNEMGFSLDNYDVVIYYIGANAEYEED